MTTQTKRRIIGGVAATFITIGLFWGYQKYARASRMNELDRLSAQLREAPRDQREELSKKFRDQMAKLTPDERRDYFENRMEVMEKQMDDRIDEYFKKTPEERKAWLAEMSKNRRRFGGPPGKGQRPPAKAKTADREREDLREGEDGGRDREGSDGGTARRRPWWSRRWRRVGRRRWQGRDSRAACPAALASGSTRRAPSNAPSVRNSSRPCGATEGAADSADSAGGAATSSHRRGPLLQADPSDLPGSLHSPMTLTSTRFGRRPSNSP